jgi:hypothetical protein
VSEPVVAKELMEFRLGDEYDRDKLWLRFEVGTLTLQAITSDSQYSDQTLDIPVERVTQLLKWIEQVEKSMHGERE